MTEELYYQDIRETEFDAEVLSCSFDEKKKVWKAVLDRTAFFPEQGGQKSDRGTLGESRVLEVQVRDGVISHFLDRCLPAGQMVRGAVDWDRRFDFMQQHTGEHMFSGLVHERFGYENVGFRLSEHETQLDFNGPISPEALQDIETAVNEAIWRDLPVKVWYPSAEVLSGLEYRSKLELTENVRIVEIPGVDRCACCAPHVETTAKVGLLKVVSFLNYKGGVRVYIACGGRALRDYRQKQESVQKISVMLSAKQEEIGDAVARLKDKEGAALQRAAVLETELLAERAASLPAPSLLRDALLFTASMDAGVVRRQVNALMEQYSGITGIFFEAEPSGKAAKESSGKGTADSVPVYRFVIGSHHLDCRHLAAALRSHGFQCGGSAEQIQGSVSLPEQDIRARLSEIVSAL